MTVETRNQNIVLITVDSLRADHCSFAGYSKETTPTLDQMAANGIEYTNAIAPGPSTSESVPAIITGEYPFQRDGEQAEIDERIARIRPHLQARRTVAERMSKLGYETAAFTPNPFTSRYFGYDEGFDHFEDFLDGSRDKIYQRLLKGMKESRYYLPARILLNWIQREEAFKPWESFYDDIVSWTQTCENPYFIWVFLMDVHHPYLADREHRTQSAVQSYYANWELRRKDYELNPDGRVHDWLLDAYDNSIQYMDSFLDQLTTDLEDDDPVYLVTGDHGEAFGEHGSYEHHGGAFGQEGEQEYHSYLYEENIHVPLVVGNVSESNSIDDPISLTAIPELVQRIAAGQGFHDVTEDVVISRTMSAEKLAIRGRRYKGIVTEDGIDVYDLNSGEQTPVEDAGELEEIFGRFVSGIRNTIQEKENLSKSAKQFVEESNGT